MEDCPDCKNVPYQHPCVKHAPCVTVPHKGVPGGVKWNPAACPHCSSWANIFRKGNTQGEELCAVLKLVRRHRIKSHIQEDAVLDLFQTQALRDEFGTLLPRLQSRTRSVSRTPSRGRRRTRSPPPKPQSSKTDVPPISSSDEAELRSSKKKSKKRSRTSSSSSSDEAELQSSKRDTKQTRTNSTSPSSTSSRDSSPRQTKSSRHKHSEKRRRPSSSPKKKSQKQRHRRSPSYPPPGHRAPLYFPEVGGPSDHYDPHTPYFYHAPDGRVYHQAYPPFSQGDFFHDPHYDYSRYEDDVPEAEFSEAEENPAVEAVDISEAGHFSPDYTLDRSTSVTPVLPPEGTVEAQAKTAATEDFDNPASSPEDQLTKIFYPPDGASAIFEGATNQVIFHYKYKSYGKFEIVESDPLSFRVVYKNLLQYAAPFLADCYDNPSSRPASSQSSGDLQASLAMFNTSLMDKLGFSATMNPPTIHLHKQSSLHGDLLKALNKHRLARTPQKDLLKLVKGVPSADILKRLATSKDRPLTPKVQRFLTVTTADAADSVVTFLNLPTAASFNHITDLPTAYAYLTLPQHHMLALFHSLKEELLFLIGTYSFIAASHESLKSERNAIHTKLPSHSDWLTHNLRWSAYGYKSFAKMAIPVAEKLGAVTLLLRMDSLSYQRAPHLSDLLVYNDDIVGPAILPLAGKGSFDAAIRDHVLKVVPSSKTSSAASGSVYRKDRTPSTSRLADKTPQPQGSFRPPYPRGPYHPQLQPRSQTGSSTRFHNPTRQWQGFRGTGTRGSRGSQQHTSRGASKQHSAGPFQPQPNPNRTNADRRTKTNPKLPYHGRAGK